MKNKKIQYYPDYFWARSFDYKNEYVIYKYLCGIAKRNEKRKLEENLKFTSYMAWKRYVQSKFADKSKEQLQEFCRYLNNYKQKEIGIINVLVLIVLPGLLTCATDIIVQYSDTMPQLPSFLELFDAAIRIPNFWEKIICVGIAIIASLFCFLILGIVPLYVVWTLHVIYGIMNDSERRKRFVEDFQEIIQETIEEK